MNRISKVFTTIAATAVLVVSGTPSKATGTFEEHRVLWEAIQRAGVTTAVNDPQYCNDGADGMYLWVGGEAALIICQDNAKLLSSEEVPWTSNDLDTLRHEAQHLIQDCNDGTIADSQTSLLFNDTEALLKFVTDAGLSKDQVQQIINVYRENGASDEVILREIEAFAVAKSVSPHVIADKIIDFCGVSQ
tara:strand:- start:274 stop:843 length:570 start_codon:yes stop_codon:yes gene_type:complete